MSEFLLVARTCAEAAVVTAADAGHPPSIYPVTVSGSSNSSVARSSVGVGGEIFGVNARSGDRG